MRYFTKELWQIGQEVGKLDEYISAWQQANDEYQQQLRLLRKRISAKAYTFCAEADVHDGALLKLVLEGGTRRRSTYPVKATLSVLEANTEFFWQISYGSLRRVITDYPSVDPLFYSDGEGFGDWGYHELTDAGNGFLRHEILFATGSVILFEFKKLAVKRLRYSSKSRRTGS